MRLLALLPFVILTMVGGCDDSNPSDALDARIEEEKKIAAERREKDDPTTFIVEEPADLLFGSALRKKDEEGAGKGE